MEAQCSRASCTDCRGAVRSESAAPPLRMTAAVHRQILGAVGSKEPEQGMLLGGDLADGIVRHVVFDDSARRTGATYSPDVVRLNALLSEWWGPSGIRLLGVVHSHPGRLGRPSEGDRKYAGAILHTNPHLDRLLLPILTFDPEPTIHGFVALREDGGVRLETTKLEILEEVLAKATEGAGQTSTPTPTSPRAIRAETFAR